ncbi:MAG: hypothetical protein HY760_02405 [Nitrospirae bacterium]|nr:hypothetical protein [Nitrospirota bacterium]
MKRTIIITAWVLAMSAPVTASAQMGGGMMGPDRMGMMGGGPEMGGMMGMPGMMGMHGMGMEMGGMMDMMNMMNALAALDLTADQKKKLQSLKIDHQKEAIPLFSKVRMTDLELQEMQMTDPVDLKKVEAKIREKHDTLIRLDMSHVTMTQQIQAILTPAQRQKMDAMMMDMMGGMGPGMMERMPMMPMMPGMGGGMKP